MQRIRPVAQRRPWWGQPIALGLARDVHGFLLLRIGLVAVVEWILLVRL